MNINVFSGKNKKLGCLLLSGVMLFAYATSGYAAKLEDVLKRGYLIVGTGSTNAPWGFLGANGQLQGFDIDIARIIAKGLFNDPNKVQFVQQSSDARIPNLLTDKVDLTCQGMTVTAQRAQQVDFTIPYYREGVALLLLANSKYKQVDDMKAAGTSLRVAVLQNVYAEQLVHQALPKATVAQYDSVDLMYQALNSGRADAVATDQSSARWLMVQTPGHYRSPDYAWSPQSYSCAIKRGDQEWENYLNTALHEAMTGVDFGDYATAYKKWFGVSLPSPAIGFPVEYK
ncbi:transporter substrate-binding domain-containing protein [Pectobacteriaceae bacterium CE70]|nr:MULTISPECIES: transporter substrate-binding domain-containing protein [Enterobacterales]WJV63273.1 transporter substrate-binding domain-containing protein [Pectobacteriaceae bacterium C52]WJV67643.1 transporter substrate-binding domain-containing protein [Pectobacteriaceae bacterium CE70]WJY11585.1 transporter substrate-binding domain-containing protein [Pectobacteriaceae bacterium C80]